jgi:type III secretion protein U
VAEKTEQPTEKKRREAAQKGQTFKSKDLVAAIVMLAAVLCAAALIDLRRAMTELMTIANDGPWVSPAGYVRFWTWTFLELMVPFILLCALGGIVSTLLQTRFALAFKAIKFDFAALNPVAGFRKIFGKRMLKELSKSLLYLCVAAATLVAFAIVNSHTLLSLVEARPPVLAHAWVTLTVRVVLLFLAISLPVLVLDVAAEYWLHRRDIMMDRHEVKQEMKDTEGNPEVKSKRKERFFELISEETKVAVEQSSFVVANPTHIAIGIYLNQDVTPIPFISVRESNLRALAVIRYAESKGVPVVRNVQLARSIYAKCPRRYMFVDVDDLFAVLQIMQWLKQVEAANRGADARDEDEQAETGRDDQRETDDGRSAG